MELDEMEDFVKTVEQISLLLVSLGLTGCTVNHHHHYPDVPPEGVSSSPVEGGNQLEDEQIYEEEV